MLVSHDLDYALRVLQGRWGARPIWIDKLSINQSSNLEKSQQVSMMDAVYFGAAQVLIWLGQEDDAMRISIEWLDWFRTLPPGRVSSTALDSGYGDNVSERNTIVYSIVQRSWFHRVWTVQEFALATRGPIFLYGSLAFSWSQLYPFVSEDYRGSGLETELDLVGGHSPITEHPNITIPPLPLRTAKYQGDGAYPTKFKTSISLQLRPTKRADIAEYRSTLSNYVLDIAATCHASRPHDYVYGLLDLMEKADASKIVIDYDLDPADVFAQYAKLILSHHPSEYAYTLSQSTFHEPLRGHPTWAPDLARQVAYGPECGHNHGLTAPLGALTTTPPVSDNGMTIMLHGLLLDTALATRLISSREQDIIDCLGYIDAQVRNSICSLTSIQLLLQLGHLDSTLGWNMLLDQSHAVHAVIAGTGNDIDPGGPAGLLECMDLLELVSMFAGGTNFVSTTGGLLALSVPHSQRGDALVYLYAFDVLSLIRPRDDHYAIVGWAEVAWFETHPKLHKHCDIHNAPEATFRIG